MSFGAYRDEQPSSSSYHSGGMGGSSDYSRLTQLISKNVQTITQNVAQLQRMVQQIGTTQDSSNLRDRLHQIQHYTGQIAKDTGRSIKELANLPAAANQSEQRERKIKRERLVNDFTSSLNNFQALQRQATEKEKASVARARASSGLTNDPIPPPFGHAGAAGRGDPFLQFDDKRSDDALVAESPTSIQMEQDVDLQLIQEREGAIKQLESDIVGVNQIFKDLGMIVHEQGEVIDSIEANVETTAVQVQTGRDHLKKASEYQVLHFGIPARNVGFT